MLIGNTTKTILRLKVVLLQETLNYVYVQILKIKHDFIYFSFMFVLTDKSFDAELLICFAVYMGHHCLDVLTKSRKVPLSLQFADSMCLKFVFDWINTYANFVHHACRNHEGCRLQTIRERIIR